MSEHERSLAVEIYDEITSNRTVEDALDAWWSNPNISSHRRMWLALDRAARTALQEVLARRQREIARTGPWEGAP